MFVGTSNFRSVRLNFTHLQKPFFAIMCSIYKEKLPASRGVFEKNVKVQCPKSFYDASLLHGIFIQLSNDYSRGKGFVVHEEDRGSSPALLRDPHIVSDDNIHKSPDI